MLPDVEMDAAENDLKRRVAELEARNRELAHECEQYRKRVDVLESAVALKEAAADIFLGDTGREIVWLLRDGASGECIFSSSEFESFIGCSANALLEDSAVFSRVVHPEDAQALRHLLALDCTATFNYSVFRLIPTSGDAQFTAVLHRNHGGGGKCLDMIVAARTSNWRQFSLSRFSAFFRAFFDAVPDSLLLLDAEANILAANKAATVRHRLTEYEHGCEAGPLNLSEATIGKVLKSLQQAQQMKCSVFFRNLDRERYYECTVFPVPGGQPAVPLFGLLERDVTEREAGRRSLVQINKELEGRVKLRTEALEAEVQERKRVEESLLREQEFNRLLVQSTPNHVSVFNAQGQLMFANKAWRVFYGLPADVWMVDDAVSLLCGHFGKVEREVLEKGVRVESEERIVGAGGKREWFDIVRTPLVMPDGEKLLLTLGINVTTRVEATRAMEAVRKTLELRVKERTAALGRVNDQLEREIAERKLNEELIVRHRNHLEALMNALAEGALLLDTGGRIITMNITAAKLLGVNTTTGCGSVFFEYLETSSDPLVWRDALHEVLESMMSTRFEVQAFGLDLDVTYYPVKGVAGWVTGVAVYIVDVTGQKEASRRMRRLSAQVLSAQEEERKRIGRELHDSTAQTLSGIKFMMEGERSRMEQANLDWPMDNLSRIIGYLQGAIVETRRIIMDLRPTVLDDLGLLAALRWLQQETGDMHSLNITSHLAMSEAVLSESQKSVLFRIAQEALNNVARHSGSGSARIGLEQVGNECVLTITDNGKGFDCDGAYRAGIGLDSMRERLELVYGRLEIVSEPDIGTVVRAIVPLGPDC
ncbi:PAS domain-containing protein [Oleidesulfovibrio sp.]|uniref:PAS domain-containing protein n=1 Tax=Oleidesulfovibrio sp. TaxID=2909707 RepID=UPI003A859BDD